MANGKRSSRFTRPPGASAEVLANYVVAIVHEHQSKADLLQEAMTALELCLEEDRLTFTSEQAADRIVMRIKASALWEVALFMGTLIERPFDFRPASLALKWTACGKTSAEIAEPDSSDETVRSHSKTVCRKLNAANRTHATAIALVFGFIQVEEPRRGMVLPVLFGLPKAPKDKRRRAY